MAVVTIHACANDDDRKLAQSVPPPPSQTPPPPPAQAVSPTDGSVPPSSTQHGTPATSDSDAKALNDYDPNKPGDYLNSKLPLKDSDFDPKQEVQSVVNRHRPNLDLKMLRFYELKKEDLEPLKSPEAVEVTTELTLCGTKLSDDAMEQISALKLIDLDIHGNNVRDLHFLKQMKTLKSLDIRDTDIDSSGMAVIATLPKLETLKLNHDKVTDNDLQQLYGLKNLGALFTVGCHFSPEAIAKLRAHNSNLRVFDREKHASAESAK
jgi:Leucine-rich repeat (LRR) protein